MDLSQQISLAAAINEKLNSYLYDLWPGLTPVPFLLYDDAHQVAVGESWPERYKEVQPRIWVAEGKDDALMGNTATMYHDQRIAIWDTRTWPDEPDVADAAASLAHEMFHAFQASIDLPWANELIAIDYPHTAQSLALVIEENQLFVDVLKTRNTALFPEYMKKIADLRQARKALIGIEYMGYDQWVEGIEGTAAYVESCMKAALQSKTPLESAVSYLPILMKEDEILSHYRHRCYVAGLALCLMADTLCPGWQAEWAESKCQLFDWIRERLALEPIEMMPDVQTIGRAARLVSAYRLDREEQIASFTSQPLLSLEGDIALLSFDPMNLVCMDNRCLHLHGKMRLGKNEYMLDRPFLEDFDGTILNAKRIWVTGAVTKLCDGRFAVEGLDEFTGSAVQVHEGWRCTIAG